MAKRTKSKEVFSFSTGDLIATITEEEKILLWADFKKLSHIYDKARFVWVHRYIFADLFKPISVNIAGIEKEIGFNITDVSSVNKIAVSLCSEIMDEIKEREIEIIKDKLELNKHSGFNISITLNDEIKKRQTNTNKSLKISSYFKLGYEHKREEGNQMVITFDINRDKNIYHAALEVARGQAEREIENWLRCQLDFKTNKIIKFTHREYALAEELKIEGNNKLPHPSKSELIKQGGRSRYHAYKTLQKRSTSKSYPYIAPTKKEYENAILILEDSGNDTTLAKEYLKEFV